MYFTPFNIVYFQTRGYKVIVRLLPHEVADVEPVLALLAKQNPHDYAVYDPNTLVVSLVLPKSMSWNFFCSSQFLIGL